MSHYDQSGKLLHKKSSAIRKRAIKKSLEEEEIIIIPYPIIPLSTTFVVNWHEGNERTTFVFHHEITDEYMTP